MKKTIRVRIQGQRGAFSPRRSIAVDTREIAQFRRVGALREIRAEALRDGDNRTALAADTLRDRLVRQYRAAGQRRAAEMGGM